MSLKWTLLCMLFIAGVIPVWAVPGETPAGAGASRIESIAVTFTGSETREVFVYLPAAYDTAGGTVRFPVLYLLHGSPGEANDWIKRGDAQSVFDDAISRQMIRPFIAVFPEGNGSLFKDTQYIDSADGKTPVETFLVKNLVERVDKTYRTEARADSRAIGGLSSGGFGALNIGLKHQDVFGAVLSFSGYGRIDINAMSKPFIQGSEQIIKANSPLDYISSLKSKTLSVLLICGNDDGFLQENRDLETMLTAVGIKAELKLYDGKHRWVFWRDHLSDALEWLGTRLAFHLKQ